MLAPIFRKIATPRLSRTCANWCSSQPRMQLPAPWPALDTRYAAALRSFTGALCTFQRTKDHVNVGTVGHVDHGKCVTRQLAAQARISVLYHAGKHALHIHCAGCAALQDYVDCCYYQGAG